MDPLTSPLKIADLPDLLRPNPKKNMGYGTHAGVDYNLTLCPLQSRLQRIYHGQPYARVDLNPVLESTLSPSQGLWILPLVYIRDL